MLVACWSAKGGSGTTVVAAALAIVLARRSPAGALLVDLDGDLPAALGLPEPVRPGVAEWLAAGAEVPPDGLRRLEIDVPAASGSVRLVPAGRAGAGAGLALDLVPDGMNRDLVGGDLAGSDVMNSGVAGIGVVRSDVVRADVVGADVVAGARRGPVPERHSSGAPGSDDRAQVLAGVLAADPRPVVVDCGTAPRGAALVLAASASASLLVLRPCYLGLRRALAAPLRPSAIVLVDEPQRALGAADASAVLGVPVRASVPFDPRIARAVDAGLLPARLPSALARAVARAV